MSVSSAVGRTRVGPGFIAAYTLAQVGAFIGFVPLLGVLLPLKAGAVGADSAALLLSQAAVLGAATAALSHFIFGALSDRTRTRWGRRKPWILFGAGLTALSYGGVYLAQTGWQLICALIAFQIFFNMMFAPLQSIFADRVPDGQKGLVSAFVGVAYPAANLFAALVIAVALSDSGSRYLMVAAAMLCLVLPVLFWSLREVGVYPAKRDASGPLFSALSKKDFLRAFGSRLLIQTAIALNALYLLVYLQGPSDIGSALPGVRPEAVLGVLLAVATGVALLAGFATGLASDRWGGRKFYVASGGLLIAAGMAILALAPDWPGPLVGEIVYGLGLGIFTTADAALIAQVLPNRMTVGRDMGIMNVAVTLPQVAAPLAGILLLHGVGWSLPTVFGLSAALAVAGAVLVLRIERRL
ncbi:hypothetical protein BZG35_07285 [Brevundimonas sp. LM2]|uniref:MFS transporter n=1 Tax=Brevundimonas sp. LM2 TaxID=1938605 RepID=UPI000983DCAB|nr:MFS transporter [Brevundimonas sp. LM2]AQR61476.1 hypothetical protein BZG35_07285 [Brevundimonas sp. LM2]